MIKFKYILKLFFIGIISIVVINIISWQFHKFKVLNHTTRISNIDHAQIFLDDNYQIDSSRFDSLINFIKVSMLSVDSLLKSPEDDLKIIVREGNGSAVTLIELKTITLNIANACFSPFTHEYLHVKLKDYDEHWFQEGLATYLSQYLRFHNKQIQEFCDPNDLWFGRKSMQNKSNLTPINDLLKKYNKNELVTLLKTEGYNDLNAENIVDFYRISAALCQEIGKEVGLDKLLQIAQSRTFIDRSVLDELVDEGIEINQFIDSWTAKLYI